MFHPFPRRALAGVALVIGSVALAACGGDEATDDPATERPTTSATGASDVSEPTTTIPAQRRVAVTFADGEVAGGARTERITLDETVRIEVTGDTDEVVHVHTYDLFAEVAPASPAIIEFVADIPGVIEVELEGSHLSILELQVEP